MPRYRVTGTATVSVMLGVVEADTPEEAIEKAEAEWPPSLCHYCAKYTDLDGEAQEVVATEDPDADLTIE